MVSPNIVVVYSAGPLTTILQTDLGTAKEKRVQEQSAPVLHIDWTQPIPDDPAPRQRLSFHPRVCNGDSLEIDGEPLPDARDGEGLDLLDPLLERHEPHPHRLARTRK